MTPFTADGAIDKPAFGALVRRQLDACIDGLVLAASTGESPTLSPEEREWLVGTAVEIASERPSRCRVRIVANTGSNDTAATIRATRRAAELGADAAMCVAPYYNKPDQRMIEAHFRAIADDGALPIVVYNVPSRTGVNVEPATLMRLAEHPRIVAVKEASASMDQIATILRERPAGFSVMAGDDVWTLPMLAMGGDGVICTCANEIPGEMAAMCAAAFAGDWDTARRIHERWLPLMKANFVGGPNPVPVKAALALMGLDDATWCGCRCCRSRRRIETGCAWSSRRPAPWISTGRPPPDPRAGPAATAVAARRGRARGSAPTARLAIVRATATARA